MSPKVNCAVSQLVHVTRMTGPDMPNPTLVIHPTCQTHLHTFHTSHFLDHDMSYRITRLCRPNMSYLSTPYPISRSRDYGMAYIWCPHPAYHTHVKCTGHNQISVATLPGVSDTGNGTNMSAMHVSCNISRHIRAGQVGRYGHRAGTE